MSIVLDNNIISNNYYNNMNNCITSYNNSINLELTEGGKLTLKQGSVVYIPNGVNNFDKVTIENDISLNFATSDRVDLDMLFFNPTTNSLNIAHSQSSSIEQPSGTIMWYDTTNNRIVKIDRSVVDPTLISFPIGIIRFNEQGKCIRIENIFNSIGYIGGCIFVLPGVTCLLPDGFNTYGKLNNIVLTVDKVLIHNFIGINLDSDTLSNNVLVIDRNKNLGTSTYSELPYIPQSYITNWILNTKENKIYQWSSTDNLYKLKTSTICILGTDITYKSGVIESINICTVQALPNKYLTVDRYTDQIIYGDKTFMSKGKSYGASNNIIFRNSGYAGITLQSTLIEDGVQPEANRYHGIEFQDKNNVRLGYIGVSKLANGINSFVIQALGSIEGFTFPVCKTTPTTESSAHSYLTPIIISNYRNGTSGYVLWSDGYCEQWGKATQNGTINLLIKYIDSNYNISTAVYSSSTTQTTGLCTYTGKTTSSFTLNMTSGTNVEWKTSGYSTPPN